MSLDGMLGDEDADDAPHARMVAAEEDGYVPFTGQ